MSFVALITCSAVFAMVSCFPNGPPSSACTTLTPNHPASTGSGAAPYELTVNPTTYGPGDQILVTISKTGAEDFRGIIVQARSKTGGSTAAVGTFSSPSSGTKLLFCGDTDNTWAHSDRTDKSSVTSTWTAPSSGGEDLVFHYSIVQKNDNSGSVFYTGLMTDLPLMEGIINFVDSTLTLLEGGDVDVGVVRSGYTGRQVTIGITVSDGTAVLGEDYISTTTTVDFLESEMMKAFTLASIDDDLVEIDESFSLSISVMDPDNAPGCVIGSPSILTVTIQDNDDVNECETNTHNCHFKATCGNNIGSFTCACRQGYQGDGTTCSENIRFKASRAWRGGFLAELKVKNPGESVYSISDWQIQMDFPRQVFDIKIMACNVEVDSKQKVHHGRRIGSTYVLQPDDEGGVIPVGENLKVTIKGHVFGKVWGGFKRPVSITFTALTYN